MTSNIWIWLIVIYIWETPAAPEKSKETLAAAVHQSILCEYDYYVM